MSSTARYRSGPTNPIAVKCDPNFPIEVGDLLYQDPVSRLAKPASALANQGNPALNQEAFQEVFLGVALQRNGLQPNEVVPLNSTLNHSPANTIECATSGEFEFGCASSPASGWNTGDLVGPANNTAGTALQTQVVTPVAAPYLAIGRAVPEAAAIGVANASVGVRIASTLMGQGVLPYYPISSSGVA